MGIDKRSNHEQAASRFLERFANEYIFDASSNIYMPKSEALQGRSEQDPGGSSDNLPSWVNVVRDWPTFLVSVGTLLLLIATAHYARKQWLEANRSANANEASAQHAFDTLTEIKDQTLLARQQTSGTFGAIVPPEFPRPAPMSDDVQLLQFQGINLLFANAGKVKATNFVADGTLKRVNLPSYKIIGAQQHKQVTAVQIRPYDLMPPGVPGIYAEQPDLRFDAADFTTEDIKRLHDYREAVEISGYTQYNDGFGSTVHQPFCFLYTIPLRHVFESGSATGGGEGGWGLCDDVRRAVAQSLAWKEPPR